MLQRELETDVPAKTTSTLKDSIHDTTLELPEEDTPASGWIILDLIGTIDTDFE